MEFAKAVLEEVVDGPGTGSPRRPTRIVVQINPATLRLQMASTVDFGKDSGRQKVQYQGSTSTLSFDLVFDTADEGSTDDPIDVRTRTRQLEQFVLPAMKTPKAVPPRVRFTYGSFSVIGVMTALNTDFDFFARSGVPLRAKCAVTIKEQRPEFDANKAGPGANTGTGATAPVPSGGAPSGSGAGNAGTPGTPQAAPSAPAADRTGTALAGESAPDFAARMGLDPGAWKGLQGITDPLSLGAGLRIDFSSTLTAAVGLGVDAGAAAGAAGTASAAPGAGAGGPAGAASPSGGPSPSGGGALADVPPGGVPAQAPADGAALAAAGGLTRALADAAALGAGAVAAAARQGFVPGPDPAGPAPAATASGSSSSPSSNPSSNPARASGAASGPAPGSVRPDPDPRALGFGFGVPLRPRLAVGHAVTTGLVSQRRGAAAGSQLPPETADPTVAGWLALPTLPPLPSGAAGVTGRGSGGCAGTARGCGCGCGGGS